jgi:uncharacterized protein (TIGR03000 family)
MLRRQQCIRGVAMLVVLGLGQGTSWAQMSRPGAAPAAQVYQRGTLNSPSYAAPWNGYPGNYYTYSVSPALPTYLTSINYPRIYGAYSYGMAPEGYFYGGMPSPYAVAPDGFRSMYPPSVAPALSTPIVEPFPTDGVAHITVNLPLDAELWFENVKTALTGSSRRFVSPPLLPGRSYVYTVRATWTENGREVTQSRQVQVSGGQRLSIDFTPTALTGEGSPTLRTRPLPQQAPPYSRP